MYSIHEVPRQVKTTCKYESSYNGTLVSFHMSMAIDLISVRSLLLMLVAACMNNVASSARSRLLEGSGGNHFREGR